MRNPSAKSNKPLIAIGAALILCFVFTSLPSWVMAAAADAVPNKIQISTKGAQPREVEDATVQAIQRDYAKAWQTLGQAMSENRADLLNASFTGIARDKLSQAISEQKKAGLHRRYVDKSHHLEVIFYSLDGSALQLRDTAEVEIQLLDGDKVIHSETATSYYVALMTPTESAWKVRVLQAVPGF
jgi:hypothetical protein